MRTIGCFLFSLALTFGQFTIDQVMSAPFPSELTSGPGGRVAWVQNAKGVRNIWVAESPKYNGRQLTKFTEDDGQDIAQLSWTPDGRNLLFVRGGDFEHLLSESPNPTSRAEGVDQSIWIASLSDGATRKVTEGHSPAIASKGDGVAFIKNRQVWWTALEADAKPSQFIKSRGNVSSIQWSPDGAKLAFTSERGDHSFIGVYQSSTKALAYLDPSVDRDLEPAWSPDSKQLAFIRVPASSGGGRGGRTASQPWTIRIADSATGASRQIWRAQAGQGSAFQRLAADQQIMWADGQRLVFPWERDGWAHLYSVSVDGGDASLLTPGEFEVEHAALASNRQLVIFSSNQGDIDRRHIWRVGATANSKPEPMSTGSGIEWSPAPLSNGSVAYFRSDSRVPGRAAVQSASGVKDLAPESMPSDFPKDALVEPQQVIFTAADGMPIHAQLFLPKAASSERRPAVVFFHGGSRRQMLLGWHYRGYYSNAYALNQYLASKGYVVLSVNYRSGTGYGLNFREAINYGASGASEFNDVLGAGLYLKNRSDVDSKKIGLWGGSYGGYLTALGLARASDLFAAGVDLHGVHDWSKLRNFEAGSEAARTAFQSSPMASIRTWKSPVLLIHGDDDRNVPFAETVRLVAALRGQGVEFEQLIFPDEIHSFLTHGHWLQAYKAGADFFARKLK